MVTIRLSGRLEREVAFRVSFVPEGSFVAPKDGLVRIPPGRDAGVLRTAPLVEGTATATFTALDAEGRPTSEQLHVPLVGTSRSSSPDPELRIVEGPPAETGPGHVRWSAGGIRGMAGAAAGTLRVERSAFRGFATEDSVLELSVEDPMEVLAEPLPERLVIPAGESRSPAFRVVFGAKAGTATLHVRCGAKEIVAPLESLAPAWTLPKDVVLPVGALATLRVGVQPDAHVLSGVSVTSSAREIAEASRRADPDMPWSDGFTVTLQGRKAGDASVEVAADLRDRTSFSVTVVEEEVSLRPESVVVRAVPPKPSGTLALSGPQGAAWSRVGEGAWPERVRSVDGIGTARVVVTFAPSESSSDVVSLPVRLGGSDRREIEVDDAVHLPRRVRYVIGAP